MLDEPGAQDAKLRADIRLLGNLLGDTLVRQVGHDLLDLVEAVRALTKRIRGGDDGTPDPGAADELVELLATLDLATTIQLVRAFSTYFYLANVAEQTNRLDQQGTTTDHAGSLGEAVDRVIAAGVSPDTVAEVVARLELRPVFTAHPTEAARRSILTKTTRIAGLLDQLGDPDLSPSATARVERRLAEMIDLIWQTDELRRERPKPIDEARLVIYYFDEIFREVCGEVLDELAHQLGRLDVDLSPESRPLHFGTWVGGDRDGNPNVTAPVTMQVLSVQHDHALRETIGAVERLATDLSPSERIVPVSDELARSLVEDARHLPATYQVFSDLSAGEAYRQKAAFIHQRLVNTRRRHAEDIPHQPGRDYLNAEELLAELMVMRRSLSSQPRGADRPRFARPSHPPGRRLRFPAGDHGHPPARRPPPPAARRDLRPDRRHLPRRPDRAHRPPRRGAGRATPPDHRRHPARRRGRRHARHAAHGA